MTPREQALLLRLVAAELAGEPRSIIVLRDTLRRLGWTDAAMNAGVGKVRAALAGVVFAQERLFDQAA